MCLGRSRAARTACWWTGECCLPGWVAAWVAGWLLASCTAMRYLHKSVRNDLLIGGLPSPTLRSHTLPLPQRPRLVHGDWAGGSVAHGADVVAGGQG
jgi:hypothetical protein